MTYAQAFRRLSVPAGTLIFTDFDLLSSFEMDIAGTIAVAAEGHDPPLRILNHPLRAKERFALLSSLRAAGLNDVEVMRLELGGRPDRYPVFIRLEDGCLRPDTGLLQDATEFDSALAMLRTHGKTLKRRIAVSFENGTDPDGYFRKYGAFCIGGRIVPQHILRDADWIVKSNQVDVDEAFAAEEFSYVQNNPHEQELARVFRHAGIDFGRVDYTVREGRIVIFEINVNPTFPRFIGGTPTRERRRSIILQGLAEAFAAIDSDAVHGRLTFFPRPETMRYAKRRGWNWMERKLWKLAKGRQRASDDAE